MATDSAQPATAAESLDAGQLEGTLENLFSGQPEPEKHQASDVEQEAPADPAELNLDDLEDEPKPSGDDAAFEIVHNGQTLKLSRDEVIENARKGFDYTQKTMAVAETQRQFQAGLQRLADIEQVQPMLAQELAYVTGLQSQLQGGRYSDQEMLRLAREDFVEHAQRNEERNILRNQLQQAAGQYQQKVGAVAQHREQLENAMLAHEHGRMMEIVPEWRDPAKLSAAQSEMGKYLQSEIAAGNIDPASIKPFTQSALAMKHLYQSLKYEQLVKARNDKSKLQRPVPPVIRPGANSSSDQGKTTFAKVRQGIQQAGRRGDHRTQEDAMVSLLNRTFK